MDNADLSQRGAFYTTKRYKSFLLFSHLCTSWKTKWKMCPTISPSIYQLLRTLKSKVPSMLNFYEFLLFTSFHWKMAKDCSFVSAYFGRFVPCDPLPHDSINSSAANVPKSLAILDAKHTLRHLTYPGCHEAVGSRRLELDCGNV